MHLKFAPINAISKKVPLFLVLKHAFSEHNFEAFCKERFKPQRTVKHDWK